MSDPLYYVHIFFIHTDVWIHCKIILSAKTHTTRRLPQRTRTPLPARTPSAWVWRQRCGRAPPPPLSSPYASSRKPHCKSLLPLLTLKLLNKEMNTWSETWKKQCLKTLSLSLSSRITVVMLNTHTCRTCSSLKININSARLVEFYELWWPLCSEYTENVRFAFTLIVYKLKIHCSYTLLFMKSMNKNGDCVNHNKYNIYSTYKVERVCCLRTKPKIMNTCGIVRSRSAKFALKRFTSAQNFN